MLLLVRHGQTAVNAAGRLQGRSDADLTDLGRQQAAALAPIVHHAVAVITSPLRRARATAAALSLGGVLPATVDDRWVEIDYGVLEGMPLNEVDPDVWHRWRTDAAWAPEGGESHHDVGRRVAAACEELLGRDGLAVDNDVVVVSHVSPIKAAVAWALGVDQTVSSRMFLGLASVTRIGPGPSLRSFNETGHLEAANRPVANHTAGDHAAP